MESSYKFISVSVRWIILFSCPFYQMAFVNFELGFSAALTTYHYFLSQALKDKCYYFDFM